MINSPWRHSTPFVALLRSNVERFTTIETSTDSKYYGAITTSGGKNLTLKSKYHIIMTYGHTYLLIIVQNTNESYTELVSFFSPFKVLKGE